VCNSSGANFSAPDFDLARIFPANALVYTSFSDLEKALALSKATLTPSGALFKSSNKASAKPKAILEALGLPAALSSLPFCRASDLISLISVTVRGCTSSACAVAVAVGLASLFLSKLLKTFLAAV